MSAVDQLFQQLKRDGRKAFMPFITAGDPDLEMTTALLMEFYRRGCQLAEVGVPYSDPIADGPVIQASYTRAIENGFTLDSMLEAMQSIKSACPMPRVCMVSYAIVYRHGIDRFIEQACQAGISGAIVPDLPVEEAEAMASRCRAVDFSLIPLIAPTTPDDRVVRIAAAATGFIYYISVTGITGERTTLPSQLEDRLLWLRTQTDLPICIGFGISQPEHAKALAPVADGIIVGSAIVKRVAAHLAQQNFDRSQLVTEVGEYVASMVAALDASSASRS